MKRLTGYNRFGGVYGIGLGAGNNTETLNAIINRLAEYEDMEEQGLLIKLPCKIGDAVYRICRFKRGENWKKEAKFIRHSKLTRSNLFRIMLDGEFGKTVFLTLEEAEKALEAQHLPKEEA